MYCSLYGQISREKVLNTTNTRFLELEYTDADTVDLDIANEIWRYQSYLILQRFAASFSRFEIVGPYVLNYMLKNLSCRFFFQYSAQGLTKLLLLKGCREEKR